MDLSLLLSNLNFYSAAVSGWGSSGAGGAGDLSIAPAFRSALSTF